MLKYATDISVHELVLSVSPSQEPGVTDSQKSSMTSHFFKEVPVETAASTHGNSEKADQEDGKRKRNNPIRESRSAPRQAKAKGRYDYSPIRGVEEGKLLDETLISLVNELDQEEPRPKQTKQFTSRKYEDYDLN